MDRPTKSLLVGIGLCVLIVAGGIGNAIYGGQQMKELITECESENLRADGTERSDGWEEVRPAGESPWEDDLLVCDPSELGLNDGHVGIQAEIVKTRRNQNQVLEDSIAVGFGVMFLLSLPFLWYFFLRRLRELRDALFGK